MSRTPGLLLATVVLAACGRDTSGEQLATSARAALGVATPAAAGTERAAELTTIPADAWVTSDPCEVSVVPARHTIAVAARRGSSMRGAGGLLVRRVGATQSARFRVLVERADFDSRCGLGLFPVSGCDARATAAYFGCAGGEGDLQYWVNLGHEADFGRGSFRAGVAFELTLVFTDERLDVALFQPPRRHPVGTATRPAAHPRGLGLLGFPPLADTKGTIQASATLVELEGFEIVAHTAPDVPAHLRLGLFHDAAADDPFAESVRLLDLARHDWTAAATGLRQIAATMASFAISRPAVGTWATSAATRHGDRMTREGQMLASLLAELDRTLRGVAPFVDARKDLGEWRGSAIAGDSRAVHDAALFSAAAEPEIRAAAGSRAVSPRTVELLRDAFAALPCDHTAAALLQHAGMTPQLVPFLTTSRCDPRLMAHAATLAVSDDPQLALALANRALDAGWCGDDLGAVLEDLAEPELLARWRKLRSRRPAFAAAAARLEGRMLLRE